MLPSVSQKRAADFGKIVQRVSGALPLTSRGQFSRRRKLPEKQSGYLFALLATFVITNLISVLILTFAALCGIIKTEL